MIEHATSASNARKIALRFHAERGPRPGPAWGYYFTGDGKYRGNDEDDRDLQASAQLYIVLSGAHPGSVEQIAADLDPEQSGPVWALRRAQREIEDAKSVQGRRDQAIRKAIAAGMGVGAICAETGLSRERVYQIRDGRY